MSFAEKRICIQEAVKLLVGHDANVNACDIERRSALHITAANNCINSFHCLLPFIDDINATDNAGRTALHHAAYNGHTQVTNICCCLTNSKTICPILIKLKNN